MIKLLLKISVQKKLVKIIYLQNQNMIKFIYIKKKPNLQNGKFIFWINIKNIFINFKK